MEGNQVTSVAPAFKAPSDSANSATETDLIVRLREFAAFYEREGSRLSSTTLREAADVLTRLRDQIEALEDSNGKLRRSQNWRGPSVVD